jgi:hypothetical protein
VGGSGQALEDTGYCEEERSGADGEEGAFVAGVFLLEVGPGFDEINGLCLFFNDGSSISTGDDQNVELVKTVGSIFKVHVDLDSDSLR